MKAAIALLVDGRDLPDEVLTEALDRIFDGEATPAQVGAFLVAFRMKGETPAEIAAAARSMRRRATPVRVPEGAEVLDTCGTGGDGAHTFNISTAAALVAAGAGAVVAKHGNRGVSSGCGSADVLAALGVGIEAPVSAVERCIAEAGIGFLFAPGLHGVMKHVIGPRREVGVRSVFNLLGPLSNPAGARRQLLGVYQAGLVPVVARTLARLGTVRALVVHGEDGLDEVSPSGPTLAAWVEGEAVREGWIRPEDAGLAPVPPGTLGGGDPGVNAALLRGVLAGEPGPRRDAVILNAAGALWAAGRARDLREGAALAARAIDSGAAADSLARLVRQTAPEHDPGDEGAGR